VVFLSIARLGDLSVPELVEKTGLSRSTVLNVLKDLRRARMIAVRRVGRRNSYSFHRDATFRHDIARDVKIGELLDIFPPVPSD
jgi:DNA-binding transcriptional ArsR family regulator